MVRKIIKIDESKCNGCGACASACHEGAIEMVNGKARLSREDYCDGLGDCLPACPTGAISFEEREAPAYDEKAVLNAKEKKRTANIPCSCPGTSSRTMNRGARDASAQTSPVQSCLSQWPVQIKLISPRASCFDGADLLVAADCTAFAYGNFHNDFIKGRVTLIGCPKLDSVDYAEKLAAVFSENEIKSVTVVRMEVPCCGGIELAVKRALAVSGKRITLKTVTVSTDGNIFD